MSKEPARAPKKKPGPKSNPYPKIKPGLRGICGQPKKAVGRKSKLSDPLVQEEIFKLLREGNYRNTACLYSGVSPTTFRQWMKDGRDAPDDAPVTRFRRDVLRAEKAAESIMVSGIQRAGRYDWRAYAWLLSHGRSKERFMDASRQELSGPRGAPIRSEHLSKLTDEELDALSKIADRITSADSASSSLAADPAGPGGAAGGDGAASGEEP